MSNIGRKKGFLVFLVLLMALVCMVFIGAELFQIKKVTVFGNEKLVYNDIIKLSGIDYGCNIFKVDKQLVEKRLESNPYIEVISILPNYPDELIINIRERKPAAIIPYLGSYIIIDDHGIILEIQKELEEFQYPIIRDLRVKSFVIGRELVVENSYQLKVLYRLLEGIDEEGIQDQISEIILKDTEDIFLISKSGMKIRMGQAVDVHNKLRWLTVDEFAEMEDTIKNGILDVSVASKPVIKLVETEVDS